jgi:ATP-dependent helicase HrpB
MKEANPLRLPIDDALPDIVATVARHSAVIIEAPPGAGKTTRVPPALMRSWLSSNSDSQSASARGRIVLVEPRRIAARAAAARIAYEEGVRLGQEVGYQVRFDRQMTRHTKLAVVTPGILLRELQNDGVLSEVSCVILDEFHERSLESDILLGMIRRVQESVRPDLRLVIMSATLNTAGIAEYLGEPPMLRIPGKMYPVDIRHAKPGPPRRIVARCRRDFADGSQSRAFG